MADENAAGFQREGAAAFPEATAEETAAASQAEKDNQEGETHSQAGGSAADDKDIPFHEHPRWKQREEEWTGRFNEQEKRHQDELKEAIDGIRKEFGEKRDANAEQTKIPAWFGGTQEQWNDYRKDRDAELKAAGESAVKAARESISQEQSASTKAVEDATKFMQSEIAAIEADKVLNPTGAKINEATAKQLLQTVLDNELIDSKGRWNYRAGWKMLNIHAKTSHAPNNKEKKEVAASTTSDARAEEKPKAYKTSADFKKGKPW